MRTAFAKNDGTEVPESNPIPSGLDMHRGEEGSALVQSSLGLQHSLELFAENSVETQSLRTKKAKGVESRRVGV